MFNFVFISYRDRYLKNVLKEINFVFNLFASHSKMVLLAVGWKHFSVLPSVLNPPKFSWKGQSFSRNFGK